MFFVSDTLKDRHRKIRSFGKECIFIGVCLAAVDFEWTLRRAIIALGYQKNATIRRVVLAQCTGIQRYRDAWKQQVTPRHGVTLPNIVSGWEFLTSQAFPLRNRLVHGVVGTVGVEYGRERRDCLLEASRSVVDFASRKDIDLYARLPVRRTDLVLR